MGVLLYGQCVTRSCLGTKLEPSLYSLHQLTPNEKKAAETTSKQYSDKRPSIRLQWPQKGNR